MSPAAGPLPAEEFERLVATAAADFGIDLSSESERRLARFLAELDDWRRRTNLTGRLSAAELASHALESALGAEMIPAEARVLDIGSGGGFPGVPIAILRGDLSMTLLEPRARRSAFLKHLISAIPLNNARAIQKRLESSGFRPGAFDCALERAVGDLAAVVSEASFLKPGGALLVWTTTPQEVRRALPRLTPGRVLAVPGSRSKVIAEFLLPR